MISTGLRLICLAAFVILSAGLLTAQRKRPHIVFVAGDHEYSSEETMPALAAELEKNYGVRCTVL